MSTAATTPTTSTSGNSINFTGLASGIDTASIVTELMRIEHRPVDLMTIAQTVEQTRNAALADISTKLKALKTSADSVSDQSFWTGAPHGTSGDETSFTVAVSAGAPKASYQVQVKNLASGDVWAQQATAGTHTFAEVYAGAGALAGRTSTLASLTNAAGTSLGLVAGQTVSLAASIGGSPITATPFTITATSTLDDLKGWVQTQLPGATVEIATGGRLRITSGVGTDQDVIGARLTTAGPASAMFNSLFNAPVANTPALGLGKVTADDTLHVGASGMTFDVAVHAGWTMAQVAQAINGANGGVTAGVTDGRLRISAKDTGVTAGGVSITSTGTSAADLGLVRQSTARDALVNVDGIDVTSATNTTGSVIPGATLTLLKSMTTSATATTDPNWVDSAEAARRTQAYVDAYNLVLDTINTAVTDQKVPNPTTAADRLKGVLFNNGTLTTIQDGLRNAMANVVGGLAPGKNLAASIGISTGAATTAGVANNTSAIDGRLTFDASAFQAAFASDRESVRSVIGQAGSTDAGTGVAARISDLAANYTSTTSYVGVNGLLHTLNGGGILAAAITGSTAAIKDYDQRIADMTDRLTLREATLKAQFTAMETAISQLKAAQVAFPTTTTGG
jgi:flagellar hook-associated protein 2